MDATPTPDVPWVPPPKLYRIGEVVRFSGFSRQTIHNYTTMGLITEQERTKGGHRLYGEDVFRVLATIKSLRGKKSLSEIREVLLAQGLIDESRSAEYPPDGASL